MTSLLALAVAAAIRVQAAQPQALPALPYETLFYAHDGLTLEAYLYKPEGTGPFPLVVYNHGSAVPGDEAKEWPAPYIARLFVPAGYALLVPERRGYGRSEGAAFSTAIGAERGPRFIERQQQEAGDINAATEYVLKREDAAIDRRRVAIVGYSFGGIVTTLAAGRSKQYAAVVVQAPGALNWNHSEPLREAMLSAAARIRVSAWCGAAENDATTDSAREVCARVAAARVKTSLKIYPPFTGGAERPGNPPGHALFGPRGVDVWKQDVLTFLADALQR